MPAPTPYTRSYDFTSFQDQYPDQAIPAAQIDINLDALGTSVNQTINRLNLLQRDDGNLKNQSVTLDSLGNDVTASLGSPMNPRGAWATATVYAALDLVTQSSVTYICVTDHTSGTFTTDRDTNGYWQVFANPAADSGSAFFQKFSGTGAQTAYTLSDDLGTDENALMVFVDEGSGYFIMDPADYTVNGTALTFGTAPALGTNNIFVFSPVAVIGAAASSATAAAASAAAAATSESNASTSETNAGNSATAAASSASAASTSATNAGTSETNAAASASAASTSATNAGTSETNAAASAAAASTSETNAGTSATNAASSASAAGTSATNAAASETAAAGSASSASTSATNAGTSETNAAASASAASTSATNAGTSETNAAASASAASTSASNASTSETNAAASASSATASETTCANLAAGVTGTSTTSVAIGQGTKTFTTQSGKQFVVGQWVVAVSDANPDTHYMIGQVTSYTTTTLEIDSQVSSGSGSRADWTISISGTPGADGVLTSNLQFVIDGGGQAITTGLKGFLSVPFNCTINSVTLLGDQTGSIVVDIWKDTYANYPPTDLDSITASAVPTISSAQKAQDGTLTGWTTSLSNGEILGFNVDSVTTMERVTVILSVTR